MVSIGWRQLLPSDAPTGNWMARIKVGGTEFSQQVKIETIKPNRLKINLDVGGEQIVISGCER